MTPFEYTQIVEQKFNENVHWSYAEEPFTALRHIIEQLLLAHGVTEEELTRPEACSLVNALATTSAMDADGKDRLGEAIWIASHRLFEALREGADTEKILTEIIEDASRRADGASI